MTTMHLFQNAETIDRLVKQGEFVLTTYHAEYDKDPASFHAEFLRGDFAGWRSTVHTLYGDCAEEIIDRVLIRVHRSWASPFSAQSCKKSSAICLRLMRFLAWCFPRLALLAPDC